jgi:CRP-like cAMP-binding protein
VRRFVSAIRLNRSLFRRILEEYPEAAAELHAKMLDELQAFLKNIERLSSRFTE